MTELKWIRPVQPVTSKSGVNGMVISDMYKNKLEKVADDVKNDFSESKFKIGNKTFVVMMVEDENLIKEENLGLNDQFLFEIKRDHSKGDTWGDWKFSRVIVLGKASEDEADNYFFNGIAPIGNEFTKSKSKHLFCVKRIDKDGKAVFNMLKYNSKHKLMAGGLTSSQPINFEEGQTICPLYDEQGNYYANINTEGEYLPKNISTLEHTAPSHIEPIYEKDNK